jgi:general secretion pathway protein D
VKAARRHPGTWPRAVSGDRERPCLPKRDLRHLRLIILVRCFLLLIAAVVCCATAANDTAERIARAAKQAEDKGQIVRAYLLYAAAAARDAQNGSYRANRDALAPAAKLLSKAEIESADIGRELQEIETQSSSREPPIEFARRADWERDPDLQPLPKLQPAASTGTFDLRGDEKYLFENVAKVFGLRPIFDPQLEVHSGLHFNISNADFRTVMEALTAATNTFMFPVSLHDFYVARDTELKRNELEPQILLTFPLPNALDQKDLIEAANVVRGTLNLRTIGYDSANRIIMVRDRYTRAKTARALLDALLLPKAQVAFEVEFLTFDSDRTYHYGLSLPTSFNLVDFGFGHIGHFQSVLPSGLSGSFLLFGGGFTTFGVGLANSASLFATYSESHSQALFDATVVVADGQTANMHIGDKYPIPQTIFTGATNSSSIYNPIGQVTLEDLGILLKMTPRIKGDGDISLDLEASVKSLGTQTFDTIPAIAQREFKGTIRVHEGEWAIIAGLNTNTQSQTRTGLAGLSNIPGLNQILSENTRDTTISDTLLVIKPRITRLPMSAEISPQYYLGSARGNRVVL